MSQLTFDGFTEEADREVAPAVPTPPRAETWYKGRVLSHSSISLYKTCPQKWKFRYIDRVPERPRSFFSFGKSVHGGLEFLFSRLGAAWPTIEEVLAHYKENWLREGFESAAQEKWFFQEGSRILRGFYAKHQGDLRRVAQVEFKFTIDIEGVPVMGYIDRVDETPAGGLAIIDYKTGKAFDKARVRKDPQLTLYQIACREQFGKPVETVTLYHLNSLTPLTVPAHSTDLEQELRGSVVEVARGISEGKFDPIPDEDGHCKWCDYAQICPALAGRKLSAKPPSDDSALRDMADRLGRLKVRIKELDEERQALSDETAAQLRRSGLTRIEGRHFSAELASANDEPGQVETRPLENPPREILH